MTCQKQMVMLMFVIKNHLPSDLLADGLESLKYWLISPINNFYQNISLLWDFLFILLHWIRYFTTVLYRDLISTKRKLFYDVIIWKFCH